MHNIEADFEERVDEVNQYFSFMVSINQIDTHRKVSSPESDTLRSLVNRDVQKIMRSQCFLMLYNLVEATFRFGIQRIQDAINDEQISFDQLTVKYQNLYLFGISSKYSEQSNKKTITYSLKQLLEDINNNSIKFLDEISNTSGNVDFRFMEEQKKLFGVISKKALSDSENLKKGMLKIKRERNLLAHGNKSFKKAAEMLTSTELTVYKDLVIEYLTIYIESVNSFVLNKTFLKK
ncbi:MULTISPECIES: MAE_28990/MAE_18760 family HEPN-like nuclease [unclassified Imperialibacter]|uniref:MAE_28990/MAE_18760 family HEPN-like nuclease n=1 Tax=unclassified Imperialibacter TaxID=2629706 RepID=UPI001251F8D9|nr:MULTISPECIES: MAE_28990/MAE_18760 family HEPN-like nuclease [unclassified Imperialibacter]CAD5256079.1 conserved hypothetical protein [Imperialibacter sp. 89]CAD5262176.1 conserved hypothetical protein [Imperialibacter sp. 75]VVT33102.1 conserved hypothetical protein [Imperialibacter sp. EC-SDR9]